MELRGGRLVRLLARGRGLRKWRSREIVGFVRGGRGSKGAVLVCWRCLSVVSGGQLRRCTINGIGIMLEFAFRPTAAINEVCSLT